MRFDGQRWFDPPRRARAVANARALALALALVGSPFSSGVAATIDDFSDNSTDLSLWSVINDGTGVTVQEVNQRVEIELAANAAGDPFMGGYRSTAVYSGDFDVAISYSLLEWPTKNGVRVGLAMLSDTVPLSFWSMERVSGGAIEAYGDVYLTDFNTSLGMLVSTTDTSGTLRVARTGNTISAWYLASGAWQLVRSEVVSSGDLHFSFAAWSHDQYFSDQPVRVAFDDAQLVPEPSTAILLGGALVASGARRRRKHPR